MASVTDIRAKFLDFFKANGHEVRPSSSLLPQNDPTLMFANAGMNQFKNVFTGVEKLPYSRAATSQKCVRAGGKHNDLENVGYTARHHTFFEMLGNFSFGDYFKADAIELAWKLLTKDYGINPEKLSFTVYHTDDEAFNLWKKITGCADDKILRIPTKDNFWSMGDTGPCGPCSEIFYDHGLGNGQWALNVDGSDKFDERFVEIWNLVFMQYEQVDAQTRVDLPKPSIDTGMGLERISAVLQGVHDNYDIDLFKKLIAASKEFSGNGGHQTSHRVIADHLRSSCFLIADGVLPSNEGRGYVLRRIMRRAMRHAHQLGCKDPLMYKLVPALVAEMGAQYPELKRAEASIADNLRQEEERFKQTLDRGLKLLEEETANLSKGQKLAGDAAFKLYDTYGFPLDLTQDMLRARGIEVDTDGFEKAMEGQRDMARAAHKGSGDTATSAIWFAIKEKVGSTEFFGYDQNEVKAKVLAIVKNGQEVDGADEGDEVFVVLDKTTFYGESGGQVGDRGNFMWIKGDKTLDDADAEFKFVAVVYDTQKPLENFHVHKAKLLAPLKVGDTFWTVVEVPHRDAIRKNHSATHLLHKALRDALGEQVAQKGSLVDAARLRFDFSHSKGVSAQEIAAVEQAVNEVVWRGGAVDCQEMAPDDAIKAGAVALFGEKYGDVVRVLGIGKTVSGGNYSVELCGGTHVRDAGDIGLFKITSEGSVASGVRRIEAVTGENVRAFFIETLTAKNAEAEKLQSEHERLNGGLKAVKADIAALSNAPAKQLIELYNKQTNELQAHIEALQEANKKLNKQLAEAKKQAALGAGGLDAKPEQIGSITFIGKIFDGLEAKELRGVAEAFAKQADVVAVATNVDGKASVVVASNKANAVALLQAAVAELGGKGGGGRPEMAQGGGPEADKLPAAIEKIKSLL